CSNCFQRFLLFKYPILSHGDAESRPIPTCPYEFPNGQGDVAKFLEGEKKSKEWIREHGKTYRIWSGMTSEIVLTRPEDVKTVFRDSDSHSKAKNNDAGWLMGELLGKCLGLVTGSEWRQTRLCMGDLFTQSKVAAQIPRIREVVQIYFDELHTTGRLAVRQMNPGKDLRLLPLWIVADYIYGPLTPALRSQLENLIPLRDSLFSRVIQGGVTRFHWSRFLLSQTNHDLKDFKMRWQQFNCDVYAICQGAGRNPPIVHMYEAYKSGRMTLETLLQTLDEMLFGNLDVTIGGLSWNPLFLAAHQDTQNELRNEIQTANEEWSQYIARGDTLLAASISESARLKPIAAFSIPQAAPTVRATGGYLVPAQTNFVVDTKALNIDNPYWGPDRAAYRPSRFLERRVAGDMRYQYWRFGFGPRQCLGKYLADIIIRVVVAHMVQKYQLTLDATSTWDKKSGVWISQADCDIRCDDIELENAGK
ncbi:uncharacterized protein PG998_004572, partial [Apiospora kogelbergensis]|uniref:uncharacterized protein n=1 Tax=Apiospora kogelbergensis TaxID=1337665 RepID=UPI00312D7687